MIWDYGVEHEHSEIGGPQLIWVWDPWSRNSLVLSLAYV